MKLEPETCRITHIHILDARNGDVSVSCLFGTWAISRLRPRTLGLLMELSAAALARLVLSHGHAQARQARLPFPRSSTPVVVVTVSRQPSSTGPLLTTLNHPRNTTHQLTRTPRPLAHVFHFFTGGWPSSSASAPACPRKSYFSTSCSMGAIPSCRGDEAVGPVGRRLRERGGRWRVSSPTTRRPRALPPWTAAED